MKIEFPDKETIAEMFAGEDLPQVVAGNDMSELLEMICQALQLAVDEYPLEDYKPIEEYIGYGKDVPYYQLNPELLERLKIPRVMITRDEAGVPLLVLRIISKDGSWIGEANCNVMNPAGFFAGKAFALVQDLKAAGISMTDDDRRTFVIRKTANMLKSAFDKINDRIEITINSFLEEVYWDWAELWWEYYAEQNSLQGYKMKRLPIRKQLGKALEAHQDKVESSWKDDSQETLHDLKKMRLALEYGKTYEHWKEIQRLQIEGKNWRRYVKAGDMADVTDDLIEDFTSKDNLSGLALEHAARRAELYNIFDVSDKNLEKRRQGIKVSRYSRAMLFNLKREGEELLKKRRAETQSNGSPDR
jgi:hypothetical protein